ncbi:MAG: DUF3256 family protein [Muribaculaceae bacterium]|nr:DUF3256 family protein [Muribaculaceae bacterium]
MIHRKLYRFLPALLIASLLLALPAIADDDSVDVDLNAKLADYPAARAFINLDANTLDLLSTESKLYMLYYWSEQDSILNVNNELNGLSFLDTVTPTYLKAHITDVSSLQLKILTTNKKDTIAMTIYTIGDDVPDSQVNFFSFPDLKPLKGDNLLAQPRLKDFFSIPKGSLTTIKEVEEMIPFPTMEFNASPESTDLKVSLTCGPNMNVDDYNIVKLFLLPNLTYKWKGSKFELEKSK